MKHALLLLIASGCGFAALGAAPDVSRAVLTLEYANRPVEKLVRPLVRQADGALRFELRTIDIPTNLVQATIVNAAAVRKTGDPGWWMICDGRWGAFTRTAGDPILMEHRTMLFGMKTAADGAWAGIVKSGRFETRNLLTVSNGVYTLGTTFRPKSIGFNPYENVIIDFYPLAAADASYSGMGRVYRKWQLDRGEVKPLRERVKGNPALAYAAGSAFLRYKFGRCDRTKTTREDWLKGPMPPVLVEHTFDDFKDMMRRAKEIGIDRAEMCFVGFQQGGHDGPFPDLFPADERFGGQEKMREAVAYGKSLGYRMNLHINQNNFYRSARRWNLDDVAKDAMGEPLKYTVYPAGQVYRTCWEVICNKYCDQDIEDIAALGINGLFHVDVTSAVQPAVCHDPRHPHTRREMNDWQIRTCRKARDQFGGFSSECGVDHVASVLDNVLYVSSYPGWHSRKTSLVDGYSPVWHVAYSGIIVSNPFYATIDASVPRDVGSGKTDAVGKNVAVTSFLDSPARRMLKVFELNGRPMFYYTDYADLSPIKKMYDRWQELRHLQFEFMEDHAEIAPDVFRVRYSNGQEVVCNYTDKPFSYKGRTVASLDFVLVK